MCRGFLARVLQEIVEIRVLISMIRVRKGNQNRVISHWNLGTAFDISLSDGNWENRELAIFLVM